MQWKFLLNSHGIHTTRYKLNFFGSLKNIYNFKYYLLTN